MRILKKSFWITIFIKQNNHHKYGVLLHTIAVVIHLIKEKQYKMIVAGLLHDLGKPYVAFQDEKDKRTGEYSFHNHEEISYHLIKNCKLISDYTKKIVRYHYLLRGMKLAKERGQEGKYKRMRRHYERLNEEEKKDLGVFLKCDDQGKKRLFFR